jgi:hypothetical protein
MGAMIGDQYTAFCSLVETNVVQAQPPPTAGNVTKEIGEFMLGFADGLGMQIGFTQCIQVRSGDDRAVHSDAWIRAHKP